MKTSGWPLWEQNALALLKEMTVWVENGGTPRRFKQMPNSLIRLVDAFLASDAKILGALIQWVESKDLQAASTVFSAAFLTILDAFTSQLIVWAEQKKSKELRRWAGDALAQRVRFLSGQERAWSTENAAFADMENQLGDKRRVRLPESYLAWRTVDYVSELISLRNVSTFLLLPISKLQTSKHRRAALDSTRVIDVLPKKDMRRRWCERLVKLPSFDVKSWRTWAAAVFDRMKEDEKLLLANPAMAKRSSHHSHRRADKKTRLYDYQKTIYGAVESLARKPIGSVRGATRPQSW